MYRVQVRVIHGHHVKFVSLRGETRGSLSNLQEDGVGNLMVGIPPRYLTLQCDMSLAFYQAEQERRERQGQRDGITGER